jgi:Concanavalin A-like lectin/glucanases superfamily
MVAPTRTREGSRTTTLVLMMMCLAAGSCRKHTFEGIGEPTPGEGFGESTEAAAGAGGAGGTSTIPDADVPDASGGVGGQLDAGPDVSGGGSGGYPEGGPHPLLWFRFENTSGPVVDEYGAHPGEATGDVVRGAEGRMGSAFHFGPNKSVVNVPSSTEFDFVQGATIELWFRAGVSSLSSPLIGRGTGSNDDNAYLYGSTCGSVSATFTQVDPLMQAYAVTNCNVWEYDAWTHVAATDDGTTLTVYINASPVESVPGGVFIPLVEDIWIGNRGVVNEQFYGEIDEVKWWTESRTHEEVCYDAGGVWDGEGCTLAP